MSTIHHEYRLTLTLPADAEPRISILGPDGSAEFETVESACEWLEDALLDRIELGVPG